MHRAGIWYDASGMERRPGRSWSPVRFAFGYQNSSERKCTQPNQNLAKGQLSQSMNTSFFFLYSHQIRGRFNRSFPLKILRDALSEWFQEMISRTLNCYPKSYLKTRFISMIQFNSSCLEISCKTQFFGVKFVLHVNSCIRHSFARKILMFSHQTFIIDTRRVSGGILRNALTPWEIFFRIFFQRFLGSLIWMHEYNEKRQRFPQILKRIS